MKIGIIGGGPAGVAASIEASKNGGDVYLLERTSSLLNKMVISGGGRCNISNLNLSSAFYNGGSQVFIKNVLKSFGVGDIERLLKEIGRYYVIERDGRIYTEDAKDTANRLINYSTRLGTKIIRKAFVEKIKKTEEGFLVSFKDRQEIFDRIIFATGGKSYPETGSDGFGYVLAESLGHSIVHPLPALTPLILSPHPLAGLEGITVDVEIILTNNRLKISKRQRGRMLIAHNGITGPAVMNISGSFIRIQRERDTVVFINFLPSLGEKGLTNLLKREAQLPGRRKVINLFKQFLPDRLVLRLMKIADVDESRIFSELRCEERERIVKTFTLFSINIRGSKGFSIAHVTSGGIPLDEIKYSTLESKIVAGLYFVGEIMDVDGQEGGYNLHWAFATGYIAGNSAAREQ